MVTREAGRAVTDDRPAVGAGGPQRAWGSSREPEGGPATITVADDKPEIRVNDEAVAALARDPDIFQRVAALVRVVMGPASVGPRGERRPAGFHVVPVEAPTLRERLTAVARFLRRKPAKGGAKLEPVHPPDWCVRAVHARGHWPGVRHLEGVVEYPVLRPDGTILDRPGYDPATALYLHLDSPPDPVPDAPTLADAEAARDALLGVVCDFPFEKSVHRSAWLAALLTPLARFAFDGPSPLFLVDGNAAGVGKGLLADTISLIVSGKEFATCKYTSDDAEMRKSITSVAIAGDLTVLLDNIEGRFGGSSLDRALTCTTWQDRVLGESRDFRGPLRAVWYGTANNAQIGADTARRVCPIRLETRHEHPEDRSDFRHRDLRAWVRENRPRLLAAALTILRGYAAAGLPGADRLPPWGSYEGWSALVRGAVVWVGLPDPIEARTELRQAADVNAGAMGVIVRSWGKLSDDGRPLTAGQVIERVFPRGGTTPPDLVDVADAIDCLIAKRDPGQLGYRLRHYKRRLFGGLYIDHDGKVRGSQRWNVFRADGTPAGAGGGDEGDGGDSQGYAGERSGQGDNKCGATGGDIPTKPTHPHPDDQPEGNAREANDDDFAPLASPQADPSAQQDEYAWLDTVWQDQPAGS